MAEWSCRGMFLRLMGAVYFCAFASYYLQYPGLLGEDGLLPARQFWQQIRSRQPVEDSSGTRVFARELQSFAKFPTLLWFLVDDGPSLEVDQALEGIALLGCVLSSLAFIGVHHIVVFVFLYVNYLSLFLLGQRWLGFQWDIFLLETGALLLLYCPVFTWRSKGEVPPAAWLLRVLVVKFMYMNGVVKVTANCPTWKHLTALEYHFASTCIPTAEAWTMHQLPPVILRLGVALMFLVELIAPWLLLVPHRRVRRLGVAIQAALQLGIMLTGNYNWFNLHTIVLLLPSWADDECEEDSLGVRRGRIGSVLDSLCPCVVTAFLALSFNAMFDIRPTYFSAGGPAPHYLTLGLALLERPIETVLEDRWSVVSRFGTQEVETLSAFVLSPLCVGILFLVVGISCMRYAAAPLRTQRAPWSVVDAGGRLLRGSLVMPLLLLCLLECASLHRGLEGSVPFAGVVAPLRQLLAPWHVVNGYGLFRRMTGVGSPPRGSQKWGDQPPSVVAVPAVVVEGSDDGEQWVEIPFRYALGSTTRQPRRTAPHQPRLDWQMWFAALGSYEQNPFFVHLLYKVLEGSEDVLALLDLDEYPWQAAPPRFLRSSLYHYDFTRLESAWAQRIPGAQILETNGVHIDEWWARKRIREYTPMVDHASMESIVKRQGWLVGKEARGAALQRVNKCTLASRRGPFFGYWCHTVVLVRRLRSFTRRSGWTIRSNVLRSVWSGASDLFYVDVHFMLILGPLAALFTTQRLFACAGAAW